MLPEIADPGPTKTAITAGFAKRSGHELREVGLDVSFDAGAGALKAAEPLHLIADQLVIGRILERQKALEEGVDACWPCPPMVASTGARMVGFSVT